MEMMKDRWRKDRGGGKGSGGWMEDGWRLRDVHQPLQVGGVSGLTWPEEALRPPADSLPDSSATNQTSGRGLRAAQGYLWKKRAR